MHLVLTEHDIQCERIGVHPHNFDSYLEELKEEVKYKTYPVIKMYRVPVRKTDINEKN